MTNPDGDQLAKQNATTNFRKWIRSSPFSKTIRTTRLLNIQPSSQALSFPHFVPRSTIHDMEPQQAAPATVAGTSTEPCMYDWQKRVEWEFKSADEVPEDTEQKTLPAAELFPERQRARVLLPSGKMLGVDGSVLLDHCHALRPHAEELLEKVLWLTYLPGADRWGDKYVEEFFEDLHKDRVENIHLNAIAMYSSYGPLIHAFGVEAAKTKYKAIAASVFCGASVNSVTSVVASWRFVWIGGYQLLDPDWKNDVLVELSKLTPEQLKPWLDGDNRHRLFEAFTTEDILALANARWTGRIRQSITTTSTLPTKCANPLGEVVLCSAKHLLPSMRLKLVISGDFSVICNWGVMHAQSPLIHETPIDEGGPIPTMYLPFASSLPQGEVLEFFTMIDGGNFAADTPWRPSWVQLADFLQMVNVLDKAADWVWHPARAGTLADWHPVANLHSMQQRRPSHATGTLTTEELLTTLKTTPLVDVKKGVLAAAIERYGVQLVEQVGMDAIVDALHRQASWSCDD